MKNANDKRAPDAVDESRMSFGDHLEELRRCLIRAVVGLLVATAVCFKYGDRIIEILQTPYSIAMEELDFDPRMVQLRPAETIIEYFKISLYFGLVLATPWILLQAWRFVGTGLYPAERRIVRLIAPASVGLFLVGASFMLTVVLFGLMKFLIGLSGWFPLPGPEGNWFSHWLHSPSPTVAATRPVFPSLNVPVLDADPPPPTTAPDAPAGDAKVWINAPRHELIVEMDGRRFVTALTPADKQRFVQPFFNVTEYLGFVVYLALAFGLGFQIPIVVVFLVGVRILSAADLARVRKHVIVGVCVLAAIVTPTPDVVTMLMLAVPMVVLFEIGLLIGRLIERRRAAADEA